MTYEELQRRLDEARRQQLFLNTLKKEREMVLADIVGVQGMRYDKPYVSSSHISDLSEKLISIENQMRFYDNRIADTLELLTALRQDVADVIDLCDTPEQKTVLNLRYLQGLEWSEIPKAMNYAERHPYNLHKAALLTILRKLRAKECSK